MTFALSQRSGPFAKWPFSLCALVSSVAQVSNLLYGGFPIRHLDTGQRLPRASPGPVCLFSLQHRHTVITIHLGDEAQADFFGTDRLAGTRNRAIAETFRIHAVDHVEDTPIFF